MDVPPHLPKQEIAFAREGYCSAFENLPPQLQVTASAWLSEIMPPRWALEWSLPYWLGQSFGLPIESTRSIVRSNVLGLAYIRLQDAMMDGDKLSIQSLSAPLLSTALYHRWLREYVTLFDGDPRFWDRFESYLSEWLSAEANSNDAPTDGLCFDHWGDLLRLAHRGAPLKVCCAAASSLADREHDLRALEETVDQLLVGAVLLDHLQDWQEDLATGRYNVFVAHASSFAQSPAFCEMNRRKVLEEIHIGDIVRSYCDIVADTLRKADTWAGAVGCAGLQAYIGWLIAQTTAYRDRLATRAIARLHAITQAFFCLPSAVAADHNSESEGGG